MYFSKEFYACELNVKYLLRLTGILAGNLELLCPLVLSTFSSHERNDTVFLLSHWLQMGKQTNIQYVIASPYKY